MFKVLKAIAHGGSANFALLEKTLLSSLDKSAHWWIDAIAAYGCH